MENTDFIIITTTIVIAAFVGLIILLVKYIKKYNLEQIKKKQNFALRNNFEYSDSLESEVSTEFKFLKWAHVRNFKNYFKKDGVIIFDFVFNTGKTQIVYTVLQYKFNKEVPSFTLNQQNIFHNIAKVFGYQDIDFSHAPKFSKKYLLRGKDESRIKSFFDLEKLKFFENLNNFDNIEVNENMYMTYRNKIQMEKYNEFIDKNKKIIEVLKN